MIEDYAIKSRIGRIQGTGSYEITKNGKQREKTKLVSEFVTAAGTFAEETWAEKALKEIEKCHETELLYYMLGKKEEVSSQAIERNIRTSFCIMYKDGNQDAVKRYLPFQNRTNGNSLATLYLRLRQEEENENAERAGKQE